MEKFTTKASSIEERKFTDKTKNTIYSLIKENITIKIDGNNKGYIDGNSDISLEGFEDLTEVLYNYVQQERAKQEVLTLESVKVNAAVGNFDVKKINDHIENLNEKYKI